MAEDQDDASAKPSAKPKAHLSDLFKVGKVVTVTDADDVEYVLWLQRPTATQQDEARDAANTRALRLKMQYKERDGDRYLVLAATMDEMTDHDELVTTRSRYNEGELRSQAFNEVLYSEDHGQDWNTDDRYLSLIKAISDRWDELAKYNTQMEEAESDDRILPEDDDQLQELLDTQKEFSDEVGKRTEELVGEEKAKHINKPDAQLRNEIVKESIETESKLFWYETYQVKMLYYACRTTEDHGKFYFDKSDDLLNLPSHIRQELYLQYEELEKGSEELKNSLSLPISSAL